MENKNLNIDELMEKYKAIIKDEWFEAPPVGSDCPECNIVFEGGNIIRRRKDFGGVLELIGGTDCGDVSDFVVEFHNSFPSLHHEYKVMEQMVNLMAQELDKADICPSNFNQCLVTGEESYCDIDKAICITDYYRREAKAKLSNEDHQEEFRGERELCQNTDCLYWDEKYTGNCSGEKGGEPMIADCKSCISRKEVGNDG